MYNIISIYVTGGLLLLGGLCLLFIHIPGSPLLQGYRRARRMMGCAYLFFAACNVVEYAFRDGGGDNHLLTQMITLSVAFSQAFLFTWSMIALLDVRWMCDRWNLLREVIIVATAVAVVFGVYFTFPGGQISIAFYVLTGLYLVQLIRYTRLFIVHHRQFKREMDNFFADEQDRWMRWVVTAFYAALTIGVLAILSALFVTHLGTLIFSCVLAVFYTCFAICFINYAFLFPSIEAALEDAPPINEDVNNPIIIILKNK